MEIIVDLLERLVALLTSVVFVLNPVSDTLEVASYGLYDVALMSVTTVDRSKLDGYYSLYTYADYTWKSYGPYPNSNGLSHFWTSYYNSSSRTVLCTFIMYVVYPITITAGTQVTLSWGGLTGSYTTSSGQAVPALGWASNASSGATSLSSFSVVDSTYASLATVTASSGSVTVTLPRDTSFIGFSCSTPNFYAPAVGSCYAYLGLTSMSITIPDPPNEELAELKAINYNTNSSANTLSGILSEIRSLNSSVSQPSAMEQFEGNYLDKMESQLSQVEEMMGPENTALPNGGDIAGFTSDVQNALGVSGSSFNASEFAAATSAFGGADATAAGGPWEFFSQAVADSLAGDTSSVGLNDDDYIYAWLEQMEGRYMRWGSFSP